MQYHRFVCLLLAGAALAALLGGCAGGGPDVSASSLSSPFAGQTTPGGEELAAIEEAVRASATAADSGRYLSYSFEFLGVLTPEERAGLAWLDEIYFMPGSDAPDPVSWREHLAAHPGSQVARAELAFEYTPETKILGPQNPDGQYSNCYLVTQTPQGWQITDVYTEFLAAPPAAGADPLQQELGLTRAQWLTLQHQTRSLVSGGIARSFSDWEQLTPEELGHYLYARAADWGGADRLGNSPCYGLESTILQADFSAENGVWGSFLGEWARQEGAELTAAPSESQQALAAALEDGSLPLEYARTGDEVTVTARIPTGDAAAVVRYTFGLVPEGGGPTSRTWCKGAELLDG